MCPNMFIIEFIRAETFKTTKCPTIHSIQYNATIKNHVEPENIHGKIFMILLRFQNHIYNKSIIFKNVFMKILEGHAL